MLKPRVVDIPTLPLLTVRPPFTLTVDAFRVEGMEVPPGIYGAPLTVVRLIFVVLTLNVMTEP